MINVGLPAVLLEMFMAEGALEMVVLHFVEAVHVELPHKTVDLLVPEVTRKHDLLELHDIPNDKLEPR